MIAIKNKGDSYHTLNPGISIYGMNIRQLNGLIKFWHMGA